MTEKTEEYIQLLSTFDFVKQLDPDEATEKFQAKMDELWYSFSEEEIEWVENWIIEQKELIPLAPESLDMVDVEVKIGESISPRKHIQNVKTDRKIKLKELGFEDLTEDEKANIQLGRNLT